MSEARNVMIFSLGGKDTIHTGLTLEEARLQWQEYLRANEFMPLVDLREPEWPLFVNPDQVKCIQQVVVA